ncbi:hypothetical protein Py04_1451 [Pyrococcus sp. ST04]|nr:hypothetical protein Py04_1451 [Pyrococcus sp. ST04]
MVLSPIYDPKIMAILGIFIAVHVSLVNVPFTNIDLFHKEWRNADMISHFLGGLTLWLMVAKILHSYGFSPRRVLVYSIVVFYILAVGWEVAEKLTEGEISFITETLENKVRDLIMDSFGMIFGIILIKRRKITSFQLS